MIELTQTFSFEAAHFLPTAEAGNPNRRIHGHSFTVEISVAGEPNPQTGLLIHFDRLKQICIEHIYDRLDHRMLNEIEGLEHPTLENICIWMANILKPILPGLARITLKRETCGQKCVYRPA